jgi:hypothetical protein
MDLKPSRPSGVVSQQLLSSHQPCHNNNGSGRGLTGIWKETRAWSPCRLWPAGSVGLRGSKLPGLVSTVPPTAKLPCSWTTKGAALPCPRVSALDEVTTLPPVLRIGRTVQPLAIPTLTRFRMDRWRKQHGQTQDRWSVLPVHAASGSRRPPHRPRPRYRACVDSGPSQSPGRDGQKNCSSSYPGLRLPPCPAH